METRVQVTERRMEYRVCEASEMPDDLWAAYTHLRNADVLKDNPQFDPHLVGLYASVRPDTRIVVALQADNPVAFWPMHIRPGYWARPLGGPFSDWHGPIIKPGVGLTDIEMLAGAGLGGMPVHGVRAGA